MTSSENREDNIYFARLSEQGERYEDMIKYMKVVAKVGNLVIFINCRWLSNTNSKHLLGQINRFVYLWNKLIWSCLETNNSKIYCFFYFSLTKNFPMMKGICWVLPIRTTLRQEETLGELFRQYRIRKNLRETNSYLWLLITKIKLKLSSKLSARMSLIS